MVSILQERRNSNMNGHTKAGYVRAPEDEWLLARELRYVENRKEKKKDSRETLESLGFIVLGEADKLFYKTQPPTGWTQKRMGFSTYMFDYQGRERLTQWTCRAWNIDESFLRILKI